MILDTDGNKLKEGLYRFSGSRRMFILETVDGELAWKGKVEGRFLKATEFDKNLKLDRVNKEPT